MSTIYEFELTGQSPMILHADDVEHSDRVEAWTKSPRNKNVSKAGDDRTPAWSWIGYSYFSDGVMVMPTDNLMPCLRDAGKNIKLSQGRFGKSLKAVSQYGIIPTEAAYPILVKSEAIAADPILAYMEELDFSRHQALAASLGFELFVKRARVKTNKHVRVRPKFREWSIRGSVNVTDDSLTEPVVAELFALAGERIGLGDWRPGGVTPGPYGRFKATVKQIG